MHKIRGAAVKVVNGLNYIAMLCCFLTVFIVAFDVIMRKTTGAKLSIKGSNELSAYFLVVICMLAIPAFHVKKRHIWVSMFVDMLPARVRSIWLAIVHLLESVVCALFVYGGILKLQNFLQTGTSTDVLNMPKWPFALVCLLGFIEMTVLLFMDAIQFFIDAGKTDHPADPE